MVITKIKELHFHKADGQDNVIMPVPDSLSQKLVKKTNFNFNNEEYLVCVVSANRGFRESEIIKIKNKDGQVSGFLIPGQALLSNECPENANPFYVAYSLYVTAKICQESHSDKYDLVRITAPISASIKDNIFFDDIAYLILWKSKFNVDTVNDLEEKYFLSFLNNALIINGKKETARHSLLKLDESIDLNSKTIRVCEHKKLPKHIKIITTELIPFTENVFLKFFYIYQLIEYLMGVDFNEKYNAIKSELDAEANISVTNLKDYLNKFNGIVKELPKIKSVFNKECADTDRIADNILSGVTNETFSCLGEKIYKIRNVIFHDYKSLHDKEKEVNQLCYFLMQYLLGNLSLS